MLWHWPFFDFFFQLCFLRILILVILELVCLLHFLLVPISLIQTISFWLTLTVWVHQQGLVFLDGDDGFILRQVIQRAHVLLCAVCSREKIPWRVGSLGAQGNIVYRRRLWWRLDGAIHNCDSLGTLGYHDNGVSEGKQNAMRVWSVLPIVCVNDEVLPPAWDRTQVCLRSQVFWYTSAGVALWQGDQWKEAADPSSPVKIQDANLYFDISCKLLRPSLCKINCANCKNRVIT